MGSVNFEQKDCMEKHYNDNGVGLYRRRFLWALAGRDVPARVGFLGSC